MNLNVFGYLSGDMGLNIRTQNFVEGCINNGIKVSTHPIEGSIDNRLDEKIKRSAFRPFEYDTPSVFIGPGDQMNRFTGKPRIGFSTWESTRLPMSHATGLNSLDVVWTVSEYCKKNFVDSGVNREIKVVNDGVNTSIFNPYVDKYKPMSAYFGDRFVFLSVFQWKDRKSPEILLRAFSEEFSKDEKVALAIQCHNPFIQNFNPYRVMFDMNLGKHAEILVLPPLQSRNDLVKYYITSDCFVLPSKAEAWGDTIIEAMACGKPVITTKYGGPLEYMREEDGWFVNVEKISPTPDYENRNGDDAYAIPSIEHLKTTMRYAFEHEEECKKKGFSAYEHIDENYTIEIVTEKIKELI